jgi:hypothetical protein
MNPDDKARYLMLRFKEARRQETAALATAVKANRECVDILNKLNMLAQNGDVPKIVLIEIVAFCRRNAV